jgi:methylated-DNA-[protein]-cysteine S-methyltransferase
MYYAIAETSFGHVGIVHRNQARAGVVRILLPRSRRDVLTEINTRFPGAEAGTSDSVESLVTMLVMYFDGTQLTFPLELLDTSVCYPFQLKVIKAEWSIPLGRVASYCWVARQVGSVAYRAVGNALARNPFPIVIPCHRAIRTDRTLGGFQGGLAMKRRILEMEGVRFDSRGRVQPQFVLK